MSPESHSSNEDPVDNEQNSSSDLLEKQEVNQPFPKVPDSDITLENRRIQIESMEIQLKSLLKALELLMKQRRDLAQAILEMGDSLVGLANIERSPVLSKKLLKLGDIHKTICVFQFSAAETNLTKRNDSLTKLTTSSRIRYDKIAVAKHELAEEKIADFTESMKTLLASLVDTQKHIIEACKLFKADTNDVPEQQQQNGQHNGPLGFTQQPSLSSLDSGF
ncbi:hypothetical protein BSLG_005995 [Batrachochytrium salamandrivorans]|nr:hypothetical protein BSLG_005995 [Batrachochytrium salamandrivorans]